MDSDSSYKAKQFNLSGLNGISDETLEMHFKLYEGYVKETNKLTEKIAQFLAEALLLAALATFIGLAMVELLLPYFNQLLGLNLGLSYIGEEGILPPALLLIAVIDNSMISTPNRCTDCEARNPVSTSATSTSYATASGSAEKPSVAALNGSPR